ncbi:hypothetical protein BV25DRAFT_1044966 [Artomyces pyxidatus]|uniref:Uncharacterized protein n=1 Tax=Artomyces pyxidatus TaxID=48021 RepID=A0ACB8SV32_9AGAM|nr:hypothetical protein BV25DRAFT_1044966 [Artomyces pyxidatus]
MYDSHLHKLRSGLNVHDEESEVMDCISLGKEARGDARRGAGSGTFILQRSRGQCLVLACEPNKNGATRWRHVVALSAPGLSSAPPPCTRRVRVGTSLPPAMVTSLSSSTPSSISTAQILRPSPIANPSHGTDLLATWQNDSLDIQRLLAPPILPVDLMAMVSSIPHRLLWKLAISWRTNSISQMSASLGLVTPAGQTSTCALKSMTSLNPYSLKPLDYPRLLTSGKIVSVALQHTLACFCPTACSWTRYIPTTFSLRSLCRHGRRSRGLCHRPWIKLALSAACGLASLARLLCGLWVCLPVFSSVFRLSGVSLWASCNWPLRPNLRRVSGGI